MWGSEPATEKQKETLKRLGVEVKPDLTKYEAAVLMDEALKKQPAAGVLKLAEKPPDADAQEKPPVQEAPLEKPPSLLKLETPPPPPPSPQKKKKAGLAVGILIVVGIGVLGVATKLGMDFMRSTVQSEPTQPTQHLEPEKVLTNKMVVAPTPAPAPPAEPLFKLEEEQYSNGHIKARGSLKKLPDGQWVKHGMWTNYWLNGKINTHGMYNHDKRVGAWPFWLDNGQQLATNHFQIQRRL